MMKTLEENSSYTAKVVGKYKVRRGGATISLCSRQILPSLNFYGETLPAFHELCRSHHARFSQNRVPEVSIVIELRHPRGAVIHKMHIFSEDLPSGTKYHAVDTSIIFP